MVDKWQAGKVQGQWLGGNIWKQLRSWWRWLPHLQLPHPVVATKPETTAAKGDKKAECHREGG